MANSNPNIPNVNIITVDPVTGLVLEGELTGVAPVVADTFAEGCFLIDTDGPNNWVNTGTSASPVWSNVGNVAALLNGKIFVGSAGNLAVGQTPSGDLTMTNGGVFSLFDSVKVYTVKATVTAAQMKAAVTGPTPHTLIAAPGAGKVIQVLDVNAVLTYGSVAFDFDDDLAIGTGTTGSDGAIVHRTGFLDATASLGYSMPKGGGVAVANAALVLNKGAATTVTAGDSTVDFYITYKIVTL